MNQAICNILKDQVKDLPFMDKLAGMVRPMTFSEQTEKGIIKKTFPVACDTCFEDCGDYSILKSLVPDSSKRSVVYFEEISCRPINFKGTSVEYESLIKLVGWVNIKMLGRNDCSISGEALMSIISTLPVNPFNSGNYTRITIQPGAVDPKMPAIFSRYSYDESVMQYLMHPYDYFALNLRVLFTVPKSCIEDMTINAPDNC